MVIEPTHCTKQVFYLASKHQLKINMRRNSRDEKQRNEIDINIFFLYLIAILQFICHRHRWKMVDFALTDDGLNPAWCIMQSDYISCPRNVVLASTAVCLQIKSDASNFGLCCCRGDNSIVPTSHGLRQGTHHFRENPKMNDSIKIWHYQDTFSMVFVRLVKIPTL
jgi:hypothetical protein